MPSIVTSSHCQAITAGHWQARFRLSSFLVCTSRVDMTIQPPLISMNAEAGPSTPPAGRVPAYKLSQSLNGHRRSVTALQWLTDGQALVSGGAYHLFDDKKSSRRCRPSKVHLSAYDIQAQMGSLTSGHPPRPPPPWATRGPSEPTGQVSTASPYPLTTYTSLPPRTIMTFVSTLSHLPLLPPPAPSQPNPNPKSRPKGRHAP